MPFEDPHTGHARSAAPPLVRDTTARLARLERMAHELDSRFRVPGTRIRFGWDSILGLIPGIGDVATLGPAGYIWLEAHRLGMPRRLKARMAFNSGIDWALGSIPLVGDLLDVGVKSNRRNVALLRAQLEREGRVGAVVTAEAGPP